MNRWNLILLRKDLRAESQDLLRCNMVVASYASLDPATVGVVSKEMASSRKDDVSFVALKERPEKRHQSLPSFPPDPLGLATENLMSS